MGRSVCGHTNECKKLRRKIKVTVLKMACVYDYAEYMLRNYIHVLNVSGHQTLMSFRSSQSKSWQA